MRSSEPSIAVAEIGSFHIGGREVTVQGLPPRPLAFTQGQPPSISDPNGAYEAGQMYVHYVKLAAPTAQYPLLLMHGGGMTGVNWESKPDGAPGWQMYFLRHGHDVYVSDAVERGRASFARHPEIYQSEPFFRSKQEAWELFRIGPPGSYHADPARRAPYPGQQFPVAAYDQFAKQMVARWGSNDALVKAAYDALIQKIGPCVIVVHSQGGNFAMNMALTAPDKVKAIIALEPSGAPDPAQADATALKRIPHLFIQGDHVDTDPQWSRIKGVVGRWHQALQTAGAPSDWIDLPQAGIAGNSHMIMMDRNSDQVADLVHAWMAQHGLAG